METTASRSRDSAALEGQDGHAASARVYACTFANCGRVFERRESRYKHELTHVSAEERRFRCVEPGCNKTFQRSDYYKEHKLRHDVAARARARLAATLLLSAPASSAAAAGPALQLLTANATARYQAETPPPPTVPQTSTTGSGRAGQDASAPLPAQPFVDSACGHPSRASPASVAALGQSSSPAAVASPVAPPCAPTASVDTCCECGVNDTRAALRACTGCERPLHWRCVYEHPFPAYAHFKCPRCLKADGHSPAALEAAAREAFCLEAALLKSGLRIHPVPGDGQCFFHAVALATDSQFGDAEIVRRTAGRLLHAVALWARDQPPPGRTPGRKRAKRTVPTADEAEVATHFWGGDASGVYLDELIRTAGQLMSANPRTADKWATTAMDYVLHVVPAIVRRPLEVWRYDSTTRTTYKDGYPVRAWPGIEVPAGSWREEPIRLCFMDTTVAPHYDLVVPL